MTGVLATAARGFTLIELVVAVSLIALMATLALPLQELTVKRGREADLRAALRQIRTALDDYKQAVEDGHIVTEPGDSGYPKSLVVLVEGVKDAKSPTGAPLHFLRRIPRDPFADPSLRPEASWGLRSYRSPHDQPRPGHDVYDVYSLSDAIGINGVAYREW
jgi:general secretion pathway protein G